MSSIVRSMARSIARENMAKAGYTKSDHGKESWSDFFSGNWRKFAPHKKENRRRKV